MITERSSCWLGLTSWSTVRDECTVQLMHGTKRFHLLFSPRTERRRPVEILAILQRLSCWSEGWQGTWGVGGRGSGTATKSSSILVDSRTRGLPCGEQLPTGMGVGVDTTTSLVGRTSCSLSRRKKIGRLP
ncbi:hypothetical protein TNIN_159821 [Trichonephila inaurata madagascariensis]|uniref:Uncharacterized protein n=1 Tax=Trichonephila inaurata madagascariensis TaxID=2747483 RepID=A0A8X6WZE9_9ARAC|nr:hypothetical protein TNIN_159821 [Trichonephila inaurata madagascariensis]